MFRPNQPCLIQADSGNTDVYGQPIGQRFVTELCTVVKMNVRSEKSAVRADTSASRGNAREFETDAELLMTKATIVQIDDLIQVYGVKVRVMAKFPRHDLQGKLDHYQVTCNFWSPK